MVPKRFHHLPSSLQMVRKKFHRPLLFWLLMVRRDPAVCRPHCRWTRGNSSRCVLVADGPEEIPPAAVLVADGPEEIPPAAVLIADGPEEIPPAAVLVADGPEEIPPSAVLIADGPEEIPPAAVLVADGPKEVPLVCLGLSSTEISGRFRSGRWPSSRHRARKQLSVLLSGALRAVPGVIDFFTRASEVYTAKALWFEGISLKSLTMKTLKDGLLLAGLVTQLFLVLVGLRKRNLELSYSFFIYLVASFVSSLTISYLIQDAAIKPVVLRDQGIYLGRPENRCSDRI